MSRELLDTIANLENELKTLRAWRDDYRRRQCNAEWRYATLIECIDEFLDDHYDKSGTQMWRDLYFMVHDTGKPEED